LVAVPALVDVNTSLELDPAALSADPYYLDLLATDPLAFIDGDSVGLARELDRGWDRFGDELPTLAVPTLAVHGEIDPIAVPGAVRAYAEQIPALHYREFPGARHDVLNDISHRDVADAVVAFLREPK
jgi:pimeloyl-ACP methyl ester carboxylesterase